MRPLRLAIAAATAVAFCLGGDLAAAHPTPGSVAYIDFTVDGARIDQDVPIEELERALHTSIITEGQAPEVAMRGRAPELRAYAGAHLRVTSAKADVPWTLVSVDVAGHAAEDGPRALLRFVLRAPDGESSSSVRLHDDLVAHEVVSHYTTVFVRSDWSRGAIVGMGQPQLVGTIHAGRNVVTVTRAGSFWRGFRSVVALGMEHIATGTDHLLFLFPLVLVAPLVSARRRWRERRGTLASLLAVVRVVSAFTVGHSLTLALGMLGVATLPSSAVEAAIAASVLATALHALRPLFPRREVLLTGAFGLVHGLAFASALPTRALGHAQVAWTVFGFNLGIELAQIGLLVLVLPWLLILARTRAYDRFRLAGAAFTALLALGWLLERAVGLPNPTAPIAAWLQSHALLLLVLLALGALFAKARSARVGLVKPSFDSSQSDDRIRVFAGAPACDTEVPWRPVAIARSSAAPTSVATSATIRPGLDTSGASSGGCTRPSSIATPRSKNSTSA